MTRSLRVNHHVSYMRSIDLENEPHPTYVKNYVKRKPSTITSNNTETGTIDVRVGHHNETYLAIGVRDDENKVDVYVPY